MRTEGGIVNIDARDTMASITTPQGMADVFKGKYVLACADHDMEAAKYWLALWNLYRPISDHERVCLSTPSVHAYGASA
jgi:hypothetical protein